jgi:hypothetical protein
MREDILSIIVIIHQGREDIFLSRGSLFSKNSNGVINIFPIKSITFLLLLELNQI